MTTPSLFEWPVFKAPASDENPVVDVQKLRRLEAAGIACPHCGNEVLQRRECPMWFPRPDCVVDVEAVENRIKAARARINGADRSEG